MTVWPLSPARCMVGREQLDWVTWKNNQKPFFSVRCPACLDNKQFLHPPIASIISQKEHLMDATALLWVTMLTCQEILNSCNQRLSISRGHKIGFGLKGSRMLCMKLVTWRTVVFRTAFSFPLDLITEILESTPTNTCSSDFGTTVWHLKRDEMCLCVWHVPPSEPGPLLWPPPSGGGGGSSHLRQSQRCMVCTHTH